MINHLLSDLRKNLRKKIEVRNKIKKLFDEVHIELCCGDANGFERHNKYVDLKKKWLGEGEEK